MERFRPIQMAESPSDSILRGRFRPIFRKPPEGASKAGQNYARKNYAISVSYENSETKLQKAVDGIGGHTYLVLTDAALTASTANNASVANRDGQPDPR